MLCSENETMLFVCVDAGSRAAEIVATALANLCEHQGFSVAQDQVDLTEAAAEIGLTQFQALPLQKLCSDQFGLSAGFA